VLRGVSSKVECGGLEITDFLLVCVLVFDFVTSSRFASMCRSYSRRFGICGSLYAPSVLGCGV